MTGSEDPHKEFIENIGKKEKQKLGQKDAN
jgi:hypothetical protein